MMIGFGSHGGFFIGKRTAKLAVGATVGRGYETLVPAELDYCTCVQLMFILYVRTWQLVESIREIPKKQFLRELQGKLGELRIASGLPKGATGAVVRAGNCHAIGITGTVAARLTLKAGIWGN